MEQRAASQTDRSPNEQAPEFRLSNTTLAELYYYCPPRVSSSCSSRTARQPTTLPVQGKLFRKERTRRTETKVHQGTKHVCSIPPRRPFLRTDGRKLVSPLLRRAAEREHRPTCRPFASELKQKTSPFVSSSPRRLRSCKTVGSKKRGEWTRQRPLLNSSPLRVKLPKHRGE